MLQGIRCVIASDDGTVRAWSISDGSCEHVLTGHDGGAGEEWRGGACVLVEGEREVESGSRSLAPTRQAPCYYH